MLSNLVVVDGIEYVRTTEGIVASGGRVRIWRDWTPLPDDLRVRKYSYTLPSGPST